MPTNESQPEARSGDRHTLEQAEASLSGTSKQSWVKRLLPFLGPAFIASIAYVDPGNFATNISGGAKFGLVLLWVIVASNIMAMLIQSLSAKLGIATGLNLAEHCRRAFPKWVVWVMWGLMELVAMATDLAEFLGAALALVVCAVLSAIACASQDTSKNALYQQTGEEGSRTPKAHAPYYPNTAGNIVAPPGNPCSDPPGFQLTRDRWGRRPPIHQKRSTR